MKTESSFARGALKAILNAIIIINCFSVKQLSRSFWHCVAVALFVAFTVLGLGCWHLLVVCRSTLQVHDLDKMEEVSKTA